MDAQDRTRLLISLNSRRRALALESGQRSQLNRALIGARAASEGAWERPDDAGLPSPDGLRRVFDYLVNPTLHRQPLKPANLIEASRLLGGGSGSIRVRRQEPLFPSHSPLPPPAIDGALERFFQWVESPSFSELHPASQMAVAQARLVEIYPYESDGLLLASVFSALFPIAGGLLLPVPPEDRWGDWLNALELALQFSTEALTEWNLKACLHAYELAERMS